MILGNMIRSRNKNASHIVQTTDRSLQYRLTNPTHTSPSDNMSQNPSTNRIRQDRSTAPNHRTNPDLLTSLNQHIDQNQHINPNHHTTLNQHINQNQLINPNHHTTLNQHINQNQHINPNHHTILNQHINLNRQQVTNQTHMRIRSRE